MLRLLFPVYMRRLLTVHFKLFLNLPIKFLKAMAIVQYRGTDAAALRRTRFVDEFGLLPVPCRDPLRIVSDYVHLGITLTQGNSEAQDIHLKLGKASSAYRSMSKSIFNNKLTSSTIAPLTP